MLDRFTPNAKILIITVVVVSVLVIGSCLITGCIGMIGLSLDDSSDLYYPYAR